jgi:hypothetical protein
MSTPLPIRGVAHPPPRRDGARNNPADLSRAEIQSTDLAGKPLLNEHDASERVGTVLASWEGPRGELRIAANVENAAAQQQVRDGTLRGLSLGTDMILGMDGQVAYRGQAELSVCAEGKRPGTWVDNVAGQVVHAVETFSSRNESESPTPAKNDMTPLSTKQNRRRHSPCPSTSLSLSLFLPPKLAMTDVSNAAPPAEAARDELVERLKADLAAKTEETARANARAGLYEEKERARIRGWKDDAEFFMRDFVNEEIDGFHEGSATLKEDVAPLGVWASEFADKADIASQGALAAVSYVASKGIKRLREKASANSAAAESLASTMKANEDLTAKHTKLQADYDDALKCMAERQAGLETLQAELSRAGLMNEKFDFSKLASREANPPAEPAAFATHAPALEQVKMEASKAANAPSARANPLESSNDFFSGLMARPNGGLRVTPSGTAHSYLGAPSGEPDLASVLRGRVF